MTHHEPEHRTTVINTGRQVNGIGWFIAGGLIVLVLVAIWLLAGGAFDRSTTGSIDMPDEVNIRVPDVNVDVNPPAPAQPAPAAPAGG
jgi:hypothetical protein